MAAADSAAEGLALRPVESRDGEFLYRLYASTRAEEMALVDWSDEQIEQFLRMQFHAQSKHYGEYFPHASFDIIEIDDKPAGRLYVDNGEADILIIDIALLPEYRRRGIGSHYLHEIIERATARGVSVSIHVEKNNPALALYERLGFERVEDKGVYWFMRRLSVPVQENTAS